MDRHVLDVLERYRQARAVLTAATGELYDLPPRTGLHVLRHLYASLLIRHGESVKTVQSRLGRSSAAITLDTSAHRWPEADDTTRAAVELALGAGRCADSLRTGESP